MESKDELKEITIKNRTSYYSDDIIADRDMLGKIYQDFLKWEGCF